MSQQTHELAHYTDNVFTLIKQPSHTANLESDDIHNDGADRKIKGRSLTDRSRVAFIREEFENLKCRDSQQALLRVHRYTF